MKSRFRYALAAVLVVSVGAAPMVAEAAHPKAGASYKGTSKTGDKLKFKVNAKGTAMRVMIVDSCSQQFNPTVGKIKIRKSGKFAATAKGSFGLDRLRIKGKFVSKKKATGTLDSDYSCSPDKPRKFVVKRK